MNLLRASNGDDTLADGAWKDSFDRLLDERPNLRALNVIKRNVRASFNNNSSYENSDASIKCTKNDFPQLKRILTPRTNYLEVPNALQYKTIRKHPCELKRMSTPVRIRGTANPFKCSLSPIGVWKFEHFQRGKDSTFGSRHIDYAENYASDSDFEHISLLNNAVNEKSALSLLVENIRTKRARKLVCFKTKSIIDDSSLVEHSLPKSIKTEHPIQPGKWRKSLNLWRKSRTRTTIVDLTENVQCCRRESMRRKTGSQAENATEIRTLSNTLAACNRKSVLNRKSRHLANNAKKNNFQKQLLQRCCQKSTVPFGDAYKDQFLQNCCKIGEGAFGEVFLYKKPRGKKEDNVVFKIIPIEGKDLINGEMQKSFEHILQEVVISMELCALNDKNRETNFTPGFVNLKKVRCVIGQYPAKLQKLWEAYDDDKVSENEHPKCFTSDQIFVVLEMAYCGEDLERYAFQNAEQSYYAVLQIIYTLAVGEEAFQFEHRDLHWGNVLLRKTNDKYISYKLGGKVVTVPTRGVQITIIDYTLSRMTYDDVLYYNDLSCDPELFTATGDYQFEIYRKMREALRDNWKKFDPKTNIFWISYILLKLLDGVTYTKKQQKIHLEYMEKLKDLHSTILNYRSCIECALDIFG